MTRTTTSLLPLCLLLVTIGCAEFRAPLGWLGPKDVPRASAGNPVNRIVAIWQPAAGQGLNGLPGRGFAGQILFFPAKGETPVAADGDVRIYVFDDQGDADEQMKPIHQFDFNEGGWEAQLVKGSLGPSYQVYLPYTRKGSHRAKCSLRIRLQPKVGTAVYSDVINVVLPGPTGDEKPDPIVNTSPVAGTSGPVQSIRLAKAERVPQPFEPLAARTISPAPNPADARIDRLERLIEQLAASREATESGMVQPARHREAAQPGHAEPQTIRNHPVRPTASEGVRPTVSNARGDAGPTGHPLGRGGSEPRVHQPPESRSESRTTTLDSFSERHSTPPVAENRRYRLTSTVRTDQPRMASYDRPVRSEPTHERPSPRILDVDSSWRTNE